MSGFPRERAIPITVIFYLCFHCGRLLSISNSVPGFGLVFLFSLCCRKRNLVGAKLDPEWLLRKQKRASCWGEPGARKGFLLPGRGGQRFSGSLLPSSWNTAIPTGLGAGPPSAMEQVFRAELLQGRGPRKTRLSPPEKSFRVCNSPRQLWMPLMIQFPS